MPRFPVITSLDEWRPVFTDPDVWRPLVDHICRTHHLCTIHSLVPGYPGSNAVFIVNDAFVVKIAAPFWREGFDRELEMYRLFTSHPELPVPRALASGVVEDGQAWPYMVIEYLPGHRVGDVWRHVPLENRLAVADRTGRFTRMLHDTPLNSITSMDTDRAAWVRFLDRQIEGCVDHHRDRMPSHLLDRIPAYLTDVLVFPETAGSCLLHGDLTCDHILLTRHGDTWIITGLIDFGDVEVGHYEYEFVAAGLDLFAVDWSTRHACLTAFLDSYGLIPDDRFRRRMMAYTLLHRFSDIRPWIEHLGGPDRVRTLAQLEEALWRL